MGYRSRSTPLQVHSSLASPRCKCISIVLQVFIKCYKTLILEFKWFSIATHFWFKFIIVTYPIFDVAFIIMPGNRYLSIYVSGIHPVSILRCGTRRTCIHPYIHRPLHTYTHSCIHTHTLACIHTHTLSPLNP